MSKRTRGADFRNVDVDQFNEDNYKDDAQDDAGAVDVALSESEVSALLSQERGSEALSKLLASPPVNCKNQAVKDRACALVLRILTSFKTSQIEGVVSQLDDRAVDMLMKYIYRCFELPGEHQPLMLTWHEKTLARGQVGCIVRVLTDRKRV